jgi:poly-gamma-glutamate capsule biosynthesis protein CapA/YwtB (metallophosphatase superfamily)
MRKASACLILILLCACRYSAPERSLTPLGAATTSEEPASALSAAPTKEEATQTPILSTPTPTAIPRDTDTPSAPPPGVTFAFVGDMMLGRSIGRRIREGGGASIFASVEFILQSADFAIGNLECALGEGGVRANKAYTFLAPPESAPLLHAAGFDILALANNHVLDYGVDVFEQTLRLLEDNGIRSVGAGMDESQARFPLRFTAGGIRFAILAYADIAAEYTGFDPRVWTAGPEKPGIAWAEDKEVTQDLRALDGAADFVIVLFHYGTEGRAVPDKRQMQLSRLAVDNGADMVVGSHSHMLQPVERYKDRLIFYGLGNFVFDDFTGDANRSAILWVTLSGNLAPEYSLMGLTIVDGIPRTGE